jgi:pyruvate/2-oxoglutarate dehydrogenase complex dihydrolipoamide acyltransferase (E2) component
VRACILAVGGNRTRHRAARAPGRVEAEHFMTVTLSAGARVVDKETAAAFLQSFAFHNENPALLMA